jgi:hypothetical protein
LAGSYAVLETVLEPSSIYEGGEEDLSTLREIEAGKFLVVINKESEPADGFVITALFTRRLRPLERRKRLWPTLT